MKLQTIESKVRSLSYKVIALLFVLIAYTFFSIWQIGHKHVDNIEDTKIAYSHIRSLQFEIVQIQQWITEASLTHASSGIEKAKSHLDVALKHISSLRLITKDTNKLSILDALEAHLKQFHSEGVNLSQVYMTQSREAGSEYMAKFEVESEKLQEELLPLANNLKNVFDQSIVDVQKSATFIQTVSIFGAVAITFLLIFLLRQFSNETSVKLDQIVSALKTTSVELNQKSSGIGNSSKELSSAVQSQASSVEQTVASIEEINSMLKLNATAADKSKEISSQSIDATQSGKKSVEMMVSSINDISESNNEFVNEMERSNHEITKIVGLISQINEKTTVINDIVFQTKLLSFNASVEAARAGEHGKGFAVVAEEVGNLASMSGKAAQEISSILESSITQVSDIAETTKDKVDSLMSLAKTKIDIGVKTAQDCGDALDEILENVNLVNVSINEITVATKEQAVGVEEIRKSMIELDGTTKENSTIATDSEAMASDLLQRANVLEDNISVLNSLVVDQAGKKAA